MQVCIRAAASSSRLRQIFRNDQGRDSFRLEFGLIGRIWPIGFLNNVRLCLSKGLAVVPAGIQISGLIMEFAVAFFGALPPLRGVGFAPLRLADVGRVRNDAGCDDTSRTFAACLIRVPHRPLPSFSRLIVAPAPVDFSCAPGGTGDEPAAIAGSLGTSGAGRGAEIPCSRRVASRRDAPRKCRAHRAGRWPADCFHRRRAWGSCS